MLAKKGGVIFLDRIQNLGAIQQLFHIVKKVKTGLTIVVMIFLEKGFVEKTRHIIQIVIMLLTDNLDIALSMLKMSQ